MTLGKRPLVSIEGSDQHPTSSSSPSSSSKENHRTSSQSHHHSGSLDLQGNSSKMMMSLRGGTIGETPSLPWTADQDTPDDTPDDSPRITYDDGGSNSLRGDYQRSLSLRQRRDHDRSHHASSSSELHHRRHHGRGPGQRGRGQGPGTRSESLGESEGDFESSSGRGGGRRHDRDHHDHDDDCDSDVYVASDAVGQAVLNTASAMFHGNHRNDGSHRHQDGPAMHRLHDGVSGMMTVTLNE